MWSRKPEDKYEGRENHRGRIFHSNAGYDELDNEADEWLDFGGGTEVEKDLSAKRTLAKANKSGLTKES